MDSRSNQFSKMSSQQTNPTDKTSSFNEHKRMLKLTFPILKSRLMRHKLELFALVILSIMLGVVPTLKAELEAGTLQQINTVVGLRGDERMTADMVQRSHSSPLSTIFSMPLERFTRGQPSAQDGIPEKIARALFKNVTLGVA